MKGSVSSMNKSAISMGDKKTAGVITFGPKNNFLWGVPVCYTPTQEQIKNLQEVFGFDYISNEELEQNGG